MNSRCARSEPAAALLVALALLLCACAGSRPPEPPPRSAYDLSLLTTSGERYDFAQLGGKVGLVYFFATWCLPCLQELKTLAALQHQFEDKGFSVVAVGLDLEGGRVLRPFAKAGAFPFPVLVADAHLRSGQSPYGLVRSVPTTVLLDRTGKIAAAYEGPADPLKLERAVGDLAR